MTVHWRWLIWQVVVPIAGPIILSGVFVLAWQSGNPNFKPSMKIAVDVSPWALTFYTLALIGSTLNGLWPKISDHPGLGGSLILVAIAVGAYAGFMVIWRHDSTFVPGAPVYFVTGLLLLVAVVLCYKGYSKQQ